jgi:AbrB family looped-hinge helix DNA binding protein
MNVVKLGRKGQVSIPKSVLTQVGLDGESMLIIDAMQDGSIILRPAGVYPIEMYSNERVKEFLDTDDITPEEQQRLKRKLKRRETVSGR